MIDIRELRVGNLVCYDLNNPVPQTVKGLQRDGVDVYYRKLLSYEEVFGIPITEELLLKDELFKVVNIGFMAGKGYETKQGFELRELNGKYAVMCGCFEHQVTPDFEFIHQLQNAFFVMEGEELTIK